MSKVVSCLGNTDVCVQGRIRGTPKVWHQIQSVMVQAEATTCCMCSGCNESAYAEITDILRILNTIESEP